MAVSETKYINTSNTQHDQICANLNPQTEAMNKQARSFYNSGKCFRFAEKCEKDTLQMYKPTPSIREAAPLPLGNK